MTDDLDQLFEQARAAPRLPPVPPGLRARVLGDAARVQETAAGQLLRRGVPGRGVPARGAARPRRGGAGRSGTPWAAIGGWRGAAGLLAATLCGVWIGANPPALWLDLPLYSTAQSAEIYGGAYGDAYGDIYDDGWTLGQEINDAL
jgi:hypothetical protein